MQRGRILRWMLPALCALVMLFALSCTGYAMSADAVWPEASGSEVEEDGKLVVDSSHIDQGYVMVRIDEGSKNNFKLRLTYEKTQLMYDIASDASYMVCPLQLGEGKYTLELFENVKKNKYSAEGKVKLKAEFDDANVAFLFPNPYVDYDIMTAAVQKSDELCQGATGQEAFDIISNFISSEFAYDFVRATTSSAGQLPDIDYCYENRMGICQDLSAVMCCMLRVQDVPTKLMIGYVDGKYYHAWINVVIDGKDVFFDPTVAVNALSAKKYAVERFY